MNIFQRLFGGPKLRNVFEMPDEPDKFIAELSKRKFWRDIGHALLAEISGNAKGLAEITGNNEIKFLKGFVFVSECHELLQNNFLPLTRNPDLDNPPLISFALALCSLASSLSSVIQSLIDKEQQSFVGAKADMAFTSAILCDPFQLPSYLGMAFLYGTTYINKDAALKWCQNYKRAEDRLLNEPDQNLAWHHRGQKMLITHPFEARNIFNKISGDVSDQEAHGFANNPPMREMIDGLERELLNRR
jgi:hypothetical protein